MHENKYLRSKFMGKYEQKNRTEQTRIHTVGAMVFYSLSTSVIYLYSQIFSRHFTHSLLTRYIQKKHCLLSLLNHSHSFTLSQRIYL